jgi:integrase
LGKKKWPLRIRFLNCPSLPDFQNANDRWVIFLPLYHRALFTAREKDGSTKAGLFEKRDHHGKGKGRDLKRATGGLGFHCLRHTATTLLKAGGVSDAVAREIIGHESAAVLANSPGSISSN